MGISSKRISDKRLMYGSRDNAHEMKDCEPCWMRIVLLFVN